MSNSPDESLPLDYEPPGATREVRATRRRLYVRAVWSGAVARVINIGAQAAAVSLSVRYFGKERYGLWMTITSIAVWFSVGNLGLGHGLTTCLSKLVAQRDFDSAHRASYSAMVLIGVFSLVLLLLALLAAAMVPWATVLNVTSDLAIAEAAPTMYVSLIGMAVLLPFNTIGSILAGYQRNDLVNLGNVIGSVGTLVCLLGGIGARVGMPVLCAALLLPQILSNGVQMVIAVRAGMLKLERRYFSLAEATKLVKMGAKFFVIQVAAIVVMQTGAVIIASKFGAAEVTPFTVTNRLILIVLTFYMVIAAPLWPAYGDAFARGDYDWAARVFRKSIALVLMVWVLAAAVLGAAGQFIIGWWGGAAAVPSTGLLWSCIAYLLASGLATATGYPLNGSGKVNGLVLASVIAASINIPLAIFMANHWGIAGVVGSSTLLLLGVSLPCTLWGVRKLFQSARASVHGLPG